jgi:hypothetical protein
MGGSIRRRWTRKEDELFWQLAHSGHTPKAIASNLDRSIEELRNRSYVLGFPRKWFKSTESFSLAPCTLSPGLSREQ